MHAVLLLVRLLCWLLTIALACACSDDNNGMPGSAAGSAGAGMPASGGTIASGGTTGGTGATGGPSGGTGATGGTTGGTSATGGTSGGAGGSGGAGMDASTGGSGGSGGDAGDDASAPQPLAARVCPSGETFGAPLPADMNARTATLVQAGFGFIEGPVWLADQNMLLFSDMDFAAPASASGPPARIRQLTPPSSFDVWLEGSNSNGLALDNAGDVLGASHDVQSVSRFDATTKARTPLPLLYMGDHFNSPNDLTVRSDGTIYFTDPDWQIGTRSSETGITGAYRVTPDEPASVELVIGTLDKPNGIALSPDESTLYVGSSGSDILKLPVNEDGSLGDSSVFKNLGGGSDGFGIDCAGNLYVTNGGAVKVFAPNGDPLGEISVAMNPSNVAFGGSDRKTLYITAGSALYSIALLVPGLPY